MHWNSFEKAGLLSEAVGLVCMLSLIASSNKKGKNNL